MRLPTDSQRVLIAGRTGSGKTMEGLHHLSQRSIGEKPWICLDFKGDDLVSMLPVSAAVTIHDPVPTEPGLYVVRAEIEDHGKGGPVEDYLYSIYRNGNTGLFIDEGIMLGQHNRGLRTLLTQGRSKGCPLIILTQRPVNIDVYALSESEFIQVFYLQIPDDQDRILKYVPPEQLDFRKLRDRGLYYSAWYDVLANRLDILQPCPSFQQIYDRILTRLPKVAVDPAAVPPRRVRI